MESIPGNSASRHTDKRSQLRTDFFYLHYHKHGEPARGCIGLVLVGVVACVSMAVAVWSIAEVLTISNSCEAWKESGTAEAVGQVNTESRLRN